MFELIYADPELQKHYEQVGLFEDNNKGWAYHNWTHVSNVTLMVEQILEQLNASYDYIESAKIASILHDTGAITGKEGHAERGVIFTKEYFQKNSLKPKNQQKILEAIRDHSSGFDSDELMTLVLIISDKLDITKERVAKEGYNIPGMRQLQYIENIKITFTNNKFIVDFQTDKNFDLLDLKEFQWMEKVFKSIDSFAKKINYIPYVNLNGEPWVFNSV